jgi:sugar (pentulose or hexulose) kinase
MKIGIDILVEEEGVKLNKILAHGGLFKTKGVVQQLMATALNVPVATVENASDGGAWGIALLASFLIDEEKNLESFLTNKVFLCNDEFIIDIDKDEFEGVQEFMKRYKDCLPVEREAVNCLT